MDASELLKKCQDAIASDPENPQVVLVVPRSASGKRIKLALMQGAPYGEIVQWGERYTVGMFDARKVVAWMFSGLVRTKKEAPDND